MHPQSKHLNKNLKFPTFHPIDHSHLANLHQSKENCLSLSNETESLLVSSLRASSHTETSNLKKQKKLNSDHLQHERTKTFYSNHSFGCQNHNLTIVECLPQEISLQNPKAPEAISACSSCQKQLPELKEKLQNTTHRLEELQALVKICFSKTFAVEKSLSDKNQQILEVKIRQDDLERVTKKTSQTLAKQSVSKNMQTDDFKNSISKFTQKIEYKTKQLNQIIELEKGILEQKISKISTFYEEKFDSLIEMVQQLAKKQEKMMNSQRQSTLSKIDFDSSQQIPNLNKGYMLSNQNKCRVPSSDKTRNQSKSKISYYLSKSNFNDTTTLGDTSINHLSAIGTGANF